MNLYPIETDFPMPLALRRGKWKEQLLKIVADKKQSPNKDHSFLIPPEDYGASMETVRGTIYTTAKRCSLKIRTRSTNKGLRIWLVKKDGE